MSEIKNYYYYYILVCPGDRSLLVHYDAASIGPPYN